MVLNYLDFDHSDNGDGHASWDAMANLLPQRLNAALQEVQAVLTWAHAQFSAPDEWGEWDFDVQCHQELVGDLKPAFDGEAGALRYQAASLDGGRCTLTLTLSGSVAFFEGLRDQFSID